MDNENYVWRQDIESGEWYQMRKEEADEMDAAMEKFRKMVTPNERSGKIMILSTPDGPVERNDEWFNIWNESKKQNP